MTLIPDGGHAEVEWGVRHKTDTSDRVLDAADAEDARWQASQPHADYCTMTPVAREITYGPWLTISADGPVPVLERADGNPA